MKKKSYFFCEQKLIKFFNIKTIWKKLNIEKGNKALFLREIKNKF